MPASQRSLVPDDEAIRLQISRLHGSSKIAASKRPGESPSANRSMGNSGPTFVAEQSRRCRLLVELARRARRPARACSARAAERFRVSTNNRPGFSPACRSVDSYKSPRPRRLRLPADLESGAALGDALGPGGHRGARRLAGSR